MKISSLGGSAAGLWIIPLSGTVAILLNFRLGSERQKHGLSFLFAFVALGGIIWALAAAGRLADGYTFDVLGVGFYLSFASALGLMATLFIGPFDTQVTPDIIDEGNSNDVRPSERLQLSIPILALSVGILAAFFMPWLLLLGQGLSGYQLGSLGSYGNFAWVVPILAGSTIVVSLSGKSARLIGAITGVVPIFALLYAIIRIFSEAGP